MKMKKRKQKVKFSCCNTLSDVEKISFETEKIIYEGQEVKVTYFTCPRCREVYPVEILDKKARGYKTLFAKKMEILGVKKSSKEKAAVLKELNELQSVQKEYQEALKNKIKLYLEEQGIGTTSLKLKVEGEK